MTRDEVIAMAARCRRLPGALRGQRLVRAQRAFVASRAAVRGLPEAHQGPTPHLNGWDAEEVGALLESVGL